MTDEQLASAIRPARQLVAARLDRDVLEWLQSFGPGYPTRINTILRSVLEHHRQKCPLCRNRLLTRAAQQRMFSHAACFPKEVINVPPWPQADEKEAQLLADVLASPHWGGFHPFIAEFEKSFAAYCHSPHAISAMNGTVTLELALSLLGIGPGDEVMLPAISFVSSASAVSRLGAVPVFVDIAEGTFNLDPERLQEALSPRTKVVMAVHFGGVLCDIDALTDFCRQNNVTLLEDAAHAHGCEWLGQRAGSFGHAASFSFQNGKVLTAGEGGALVTADHDFAERARSIANCGRIIGRSFYEHHRLGTNYRLTALQAAVLICQLERLPAQNARRTANARLLKQLLADRAEIIWQNEPAQQTANCHYLLTGRLRRAVNRDAFIGRLQSAGIPCSAFYPHTLYQNPVYNQTECRVMPCPQAEARVKDGFWLGHRLLLADEEAIQKTAAVMREALTTSRQAPSAFALTGQ